MNRTSQNILKVKPGCSKFMAKRVTIITAHNGLHDLCESKTCFADGVGFKLLLGHYIKVLFIFMTPQS